jgi:hypothetical protein
MALRRELKAVTEVLEDPANADLDSDDIADALISALDKVRAEHNRLAVVVRHRWNGGTYSLAVLGPYSTRSVTEAKRMGEAACVSLAHPGDGMYALAPAYPSPRAAWDELKPPPQADILREQVRSSLAAWVPDDSKARPACSCGLRGNHLCFVHPERSSQT